MCVNLFHSDEEDSDLFMPCKKKKSCSALDSDNEDTSASTKSTSCKYALKALPKSISKTAEDSVPLPDPFILPKNFRPDVTAALESGKMNKEANKAFLSTIASSMFSYKRYPTHEDYINVARAIVGKYPFMRSPTGKPYVSISIAL